MTGPRASRGLLLLVWLACWSARPARGQASGSSAQAANLDQLLAAFRAPNVRDIVIVGDISLAAIAPGYKPIRLTRNVTVRGAGAPPGPVLDLAFKPEVLEVCPRCWLTLRDLVLTNARRGTGEAVDSVATGEVGTAVVALQNVVRLRLACTRARDVAIASEDIPRSAAVPRSASGVQETAVRDVTYQGASYPGTLVMLDYSEQLPMEHMEGRVTIGKFGGTGHSGGYSVWSRNVPRVCKAIVSESCLLVKPADDCVSEVIDQLTAARAAGGKSNAAVVGAAVGATLGVAGLLVVAGLLWSRRVRRRRVQQQQQQQLKLQHTGDSEEGSLPRLRSFGSPQGSGPPKPGRVSIDVRSMPRQQQLAGLAGGIEGWSVAAISTNTRVEGPMEDVTVEFGELIGQGSYGRVHKAVWCGREVAVKVIDHDVVALPAVESEADLLLSLHHPNLVDAYHYVAYIQDAPPGSATVRTSSVASSSCSQLRHSVSRGDGLLGAEPDSPSGQCAAGPPVEPPGVQQQLPPPPAPWQELGAAGVSTSAASSGRAGGALHSSNSSGVNKTTSSWQTAKQPAKCMTWLVMEYMDLGTLSDVAAARWSSEHEGDGRAEQMIERLLLLLDTAMGLEALHAECVCHGDLNARNGLSRVIHEQQTHRTTNTLGTMSHMPAELLRYGRMSPAVDVYSFGVMMCELYTGEPAFQKIHQWQLFETVVLHNQRPIVPRDIPADYERVMRACWDTEPSRRPNATALVQALRLMVQARQHAAAGAAGAAGAPPPGLVQALADVLGQPQQQPPHRAADPEQQQPAAGGLPLPAGKEHAPPPSGAVVGSPAASDASWRGFVHEDADPVISDKLHPVALQPGPHDGAHDGTIEERHGSGTAWFV
ncbi:serine/threonine-protein kinase/receptor R831 [Scenedesmus sp. PABB004]|nr:serine/threonine-protein kinase/receptor R831 [Scenedesmus sp. PABB004]